MRPVTLYTRAICIFCLRAKILERLYERTGTSNRVELLAWWRAHT